jgi:hypothetical protein
MSEKLREAVALIKEGDKPGAAKILSSIVQNDPDNANAWYGLSLCMDEPDKRKYCLQRVLNINPSHDKAKQTLERLSASSGKEIVKEENIITISETKLVKIFGMILGVLIMVIGVIYLIPAKAPTSSYISATSTPKSMLPPTWTPIPTATKTSLLSANGLIKIIPKLSDLPDGFNLENRRGPVIEESGGLFQVSYMNYGAQNGEVTALLYGVMCFASDEEAANYYQNLWDNYSSEANSKQGANITEFENVSPLLDDGVGTYVYPEEDGFVVSILWGRSGSVIIKTTTMTIPPMSIDLSDSFMQFGKESFYYFFLAADNLTQLNE